MSIKRGEITTKIIKNGLVFNMDAANRASYPKTGTTVTDTIGSDTGTLNGATFLTDDSGVFNFDGIDDSLSIPSSFTLLANKLAFSISFWFKQIDFLYNRTVLHQGNGIKFRTSTNSKLFGNIYTFSSKTLNSNSFNENEWQNFMIIYDGSSLKLYQNASVADTDTGVSGNTPNTTGLFAWAAHTNLSSEPNECQIASIQFYNRALSAEEVLYNYNGLKSRFGL